MGDMSTIPLGDDSKDPSKKKVYRGTTGRDGRPRKPKTKTNQYPSGGGGGMPGFQQVLYNPGLMLLFACFWPLAFLALYASSSTGSVGGGGGGAEVSPFAAVATDRQLLLDKLDKFEVRKVLDRVDVMGYGPTHPRVAFVVVGETKEALTESVKSIFETTDWNRIFVVFAVLDDGTTVDDPDLVADLEAVEKESTPKHWQDLKNKMKIHSTSDGGEQAYHATKLHVEFHPERRGLAASRADAAEFVQILVRTHEDAGFKSPDEDVILLLLQGGSRFADKGWLKEVTPALIVKPPLLQLRNHDVALKLANAISFHTEGQGKRTSFDARFAPITSAAPADDINLSSGKNFRTPAVNGAAVAMRLETFLSLPETDRGMSSDPWSANLDLSLNLWLCADGIDIIEDLEVIPPEGGIHPVGTPMKVEQMARLTSVYMDDEFRERFFQAYADEINDSNSENDDAISAVTRVEWETALSKSKRLTQSSQQLYKRCRSFEWYIKEVNTDLSGVLEKKIVADHRFDPPEDQKAKEAAARQAHEEEAERAKRKAEEEEKKEEEAAHIEWELEEKAKGANEKIKEFLEKAKEGGAENVKELYEKFKREEAEKAREAEAEKAAEAAAEKTREAEAEKAREAAAEKAKAADAEAAAAAAAANNQQQDAAAAKDLVEKKEEAQQAPPEDHHNAPPDSDKKQAEQHKEEAIEEKPEERNEPEKKKPSKPLRPINLEIVQRPKMVDISYVDVSGGHKEHPHMGALDVDGKPGYVHDETALRKDPPAFGYSEQELAAKCAKDDANREMMVERVVVEEEYDRKMNESGQPRDKIFCLVYTIEKNHNRIPNIRRTWGPKCDGFMVGSTKTDPSIGAVNILHEGPEEYDNIWQKVRSMWSYIYDNYYEKYDWFHIGGDDLFLIVENLRFYLESEEIRTAANGGIYLPEGNETKQTPLLLGRRFAYQGDMNNIFTSGGSGYTMNKAAFKLLVTEGFPNYFPHLKTFSEDTMASRLFKKIDNIVPYDTKDDNGGERYMPFMPGDHLLYQMPKDHSKDWYATYSIDIKEGLEHCSPQSLAFHYVKGEAMRRLFALAYGMCPEEIVPPRKPAIDPAKLLE